MGDGQDIKFPASSIFFITFVTNTSYIYCNKSKFCNKPMNGATGFQIVSKRALGKCLGRGYIRFIGG